MLVEIANENGVSIGNVVKELLEEKQSQTNDGKSTMPTILVFSNFKGGVSKTTSVKEIGYILSTKGFKTLLIDLDGQSNLSSSFEVYDPQRLKGYIADVILADAFGKRKDLYDVILHTEYENLDLVPANLAFAAADNKIRSQEGGAIDRRLLYAIQDMYKAQREATDEPYDYILIDCPPTADSVVQNAILSLQAGSPCSMIVVPVNPDVQAIDGMDRTLDLVDILTSDNRLPKPKVMVLWTQSTERTTVFRELYREFTQKTHPNIPVFKSIITSSAKVGEARSALEPLFKYEPTVRPAQRYLDVTNEILLMTQSDPEILLNLAKYPVDDEAPSE
jgi:chromosome partitioning protein